MKQVIFTTMFALSAFILSLFASWQVLAKFDFFYPQVYQLIDIGEHIDFYGRQNRYRFNFETTNLEERHRVFTAINQAVHNHGEGLGEIRYYRPDGSEINALLHRAEIVHLQDVANLIDVLTVIGMFALFAFVALLVVIRLKKFSVVCLSRQLLVLLGAITLTALIVLLIGAERVFYALHVAVFPDGHQWYFYYQDSLMSTLMKAPDLFAVIALEIVVLTIGVFTLLVFSARRLCR